MAVLPNSAAIARNVPTPSAQTQPNLYPTADYSTQQFVDPLGTERQKIREPLQNNVLNYGTNAKGEKQSPEEFARQARSMYEEMYKGAIPEPRLHQESLRPGHISTTARNANTDLLKAHALAQSNMRQAGMNDIMNLAQNAFNQQHAFGAEELRTLGNSYTTTTTGIDNARQRAIEAARLDIEANRAIREKEGAMADPFTMLGIPRPGRTPTNQIIDQYQGPNQPISQQQAQSTPQAASMSQQAAEAPMMSRAEQLMREHDSYATGQGLQTEGAGGAIGDPILAQRKSATNPEFLESFGYSKGADGQVRNARGEIISPAHLMEQYAGARTKKLEETLGEGGFQGLIQDLTNTDFWGGGDRRQQAVQKLASVQDYLTPTQMKQLRDAVGIHIGTRTSSGMPFDWGNPDNFRNVEVVGGATELPFIERLRNALNPLTAAGWNSTKFRTDNPNQPYVYGNVDDSTMQLLELLNPGNTGADRFAARQKIIEDLRAQQAAQANNRPQSEFNYSY